MARISITIYKKSVGASTVSIIGSILFFVGLCLLLAMQIVVSLICIGIGLLFYLLWAPAIAKRKTFKLWVKELKNKGVLDEMSCSEEVCLNVYATNPCAKTIRLIRKYNTNAASVIESTCQKSKR